jgi:hypothetical protein
MTRLLLPRIKPHLRKMGLFGAITEVTLTVHAT